MEEVGLPLQESPGITVSLSEESSGLQETHSQNYIQTIKGNLLLKNWCQRESEKDKDGRGSHIGGSKNGKLAVSGARSKAQKPDP